MAASMVDKQRVLQELTLGSRIAEEEAGELASYFVETEQWRRVWLGDVDVVYGPKGSGKSAIYSTLVARENELFDRGILIAPAVKPRGSGAFEGMTDDPPTSEAEFVGLWKIYFLLLIAEKIEDFGMDSDATRQLIQILTDAKLRPPGRRTLKSVLTSARNYVRRIFSVHEIEPSLQLDPTGGFSISGRIQFSEPTPEERAKGAVQVDDLFELADEIWAGADYQVWLLLDRLDVAFEGSSALESNALRALFRVYLDVLPYENLRLKIFLRTDIWRTITANGFREASHITRDLTLAWDRPSLLRLVVQRLIKNQNIQDFYDASQNDVLSSNIGQQDFFDRVYPRQVESGPNQSQTFDWCMRRTQDGTGQTAPRELIHLVTAARDAQLRFLDLGIPPPAGQALFTPQALKDALPEVSEARLTRTMYAEFAELKTFMEALRGGKTNHNSASLSAAWGLPLESARETAERLAEIGFFERRKSETGGNLFWVPFLYRPALELVQGSADGVVPPFREDGAMKWPENDDDLFGDFFEEDVPGEALPKSPTAP
ncbi:P-loop ATPase, Sll1717 family [Micromonospora sp. NPDC047620]|uniref:P-loop ATPase, Sll1717 family n=1 Tax=Micromonospora sp. NPDC047620 TaxID=3364251 RepID=UPI0037225ED7